MFKRLRVGNGFCNQRTVQGSDVVPNDLDKLIFLNHPQGAYLLPALNAADQFERITSSSFIGKPVPLQGAEAHLPRRFLGQKSI